ncbi:MAG: hypothetical protein H7222_09975 [Methylotenera sp.]|nr:hypothetical protein [Oligoflexia bacterium]
MQQPTQRKQSRFWRFVYAWWPRVLRVLERIRVHSERQEFLRGTLAKPFSPHEIEAYLLRQGYEHVILAWMDPGELLSMRKVDREIYQYHFRLFSDGEIRCHYEFSSEGNPWGHVTEQSFEPRAAEFDALLGEYLVKTGLSPDLKKGPEAEAPSPIAMTVGTLGTENSEFDRGHAVSTPAAAHALAGEVRDSIE